MSKVRREKHKNLVFWQQIDKSINRVDTYRFMPRWKQVEKAIDERILKHE